MRPIAKDPEAPTSFAGPVENASAVPPHRPLDVFPHLKPFKTVMFRKGSGHVWVLPCHLSGSQTDGRGGIIPITHTSNGGSDE